MNTPSENPEDFYALFHGVSEDPIARWKAIPMSWSQFSCWETNKKQWFDRYILGKKGYATKEMVYGNVIGDRIQNEPDFVPSIPRLKHFEYTIKCTFERIPLIGHIDNYEHSVVHEFKTGKVSWTQKRVDDHRQLDFYAMLLWLSEKIPPQTLKIRLYWLPTEDVVEVSEYGHDVSVRIIEPCVPVVFETTRSMTHVVKLLGDIKKARKDMHTYALAQLRG